MFKKIVMILLGGAVIVSLFLAFLPSPAKKMSSSEPKIALIHVEGVIMSGRNQGTLFGDMGGVDAVIRQLREAGEDSSVKAIVLRVNTPGGSVPATQELGTEITRIRVAGKPIVTSMGDVAASGGYWLAAMTDKVYANPSTMTGSIGVYIPYANWEELYKKIGISQEKIKSGSHKDILSPDRPITPQERAILQSMVDDIYEQFVAVVSEGRGMDSARVRELADGRIYTGKQAKALGLVDELGNLYDAIDATAQMVGIQGKPKIKEYGKNSPLNMLLEGRGGVRIEDVLGRQLKNDLPIMAPLVMPERW